jgi:hypothetical protein
VKLYAPLVQGLAALLVIAVVVRVVWELLAPALLPVSVIALVLVLGVAAYRRR